MGRTKPSLIGTQGWGGERRKKGLGEQQVHLLHMLPCRYISVQDADERVGVGVFSFLLQGTMVMLKISAFLVAYALVICQMYCSQAAPAR